MDSNIKDYKKLDMEKITKRITKTITFEEALKDVTPMQWSEDVLSGKKKVTLTTYDQ